MSIGDVSSNERGSGARFNGGKPSIELIPFRILALTTEQETIKEAFYLLDSYQFSGDIKYLQSLFSYLSIHVNDCAYVFDYGRKKYASWNWLKGMQWSIPLACIGRHLLKLKDGELLDEESGYSHWGHVLCNIVMLITYNEVYKEGNDLPSLNFDAKP
jgi:hypothetical protein